MCNLKEMVPAITDFNALLKTTKTKKKSLVFAQFTEQLDNYDNEFHY